MSTEQESGKVEVKCSCGFEKAIRFDPAKEEMASARADLAYEVARHPWTCSGELTWTPEL